MARVNLPSLKPSAAGVSPLDARMEAYMSDPRITMFMLPMPISQRAPKDDISLEVKTTVGDADSPNPKKGPKKRKTRAEKSCPDELKKYKMNYTHGRICWSFNLKDGCSLKTEKVDQRIPCVCGMSQTRAQCSGVQEQSLRSRPVVLQLNPSRPEKIAQWVSLMFH